MWYKIRNINGVDVFALWVIIIFLSGIASFYNFYVTQYPGCNYRSIGMCVPAIQIAIGYIAYVYFEEKKIPLRFIKECSMYFATALIISCASNAVQYTPFQPIDDTLIGIERFFHIHIESIVFWTNQSPLFKQGLSIIYNSITFELYLIPIAVLIVKQYAYFREFCFMLLATCILGYLFYYFFPTTAPASVLNQSLFQETQIMTGLKFWQIHHHISPSSTEGGLIAMPSFHIIWALLCTFLVRFSNPFFYIMLVYNMMVILSCVLLGWHYSIDVLGSIFTIFLAKRFLIKTNSWRQPTFRTTVFFR